MNKFLVFFLILTVVVCVGIFVFAKKDANPTGDKIILYYGDGCPHCENVDKYLEENKIAEKISFEKKEVFNNEKNSAEMVQKAKTCGLSGDQVGVPFLWDGSKCYEGDQDVINFFKQKTGSN